MTPAKIRYILSGLKAEIRRETDRDRVRRLCIMGMHWNDELKNEQFRRDSTVCSECQERKHYSCFGFSTYQGHTYRRGVCRRCMNTRIVSIRRQKLLTECFAKHRAISDI